MFKALLWRFIRAIQKFFAVKLKVTRSDYVLDHRGLVDVWKHSNWHHKDHGLAQMSILRRWWLIHGVDILYSWLNKVIKTNGVWGKEYNSSTEDSYSIFVPILGDVQFVDCNVLDIASIEFYIFHYRFFIEVGDERSFPFYPIIKNWYAERRRRKDLHGTHTITI